jgi:hypothetical protein
MRTDTTHPDLCPGLRWKEQFLTAEPDPIVQACSDSLFWCVHTQTCIGPDGRVAEPGKCHSRRRPCHGTGKCDDLLAGSESNMKAEL